MTLLFRFDIDMAIVIEEWYELLVDDNNNMLPLSRFTKKQKEEVLTDTKAKLALE